LVDGDVVCRVGCGCARVYDDVADELPLGKVRMPRLGELPEYGANDIETISTRFDALANEIKAFDDVLLPLLIPRA
jgi:hypothetical protein